MQFDDRTDDALVILTLSRNRAAFDTLHKRCRERVQRKCQQMLKNDEEAEDAIQTTFIHAHSGIMAGQYTPGNFMAWLLRVAHYVCLDIIKGRKPEIQLSPNVPTRDDIDAGLQGCMEQSLATLSKEDQLLLFFKYEQGLSYTEIMTINSWEFDTVRRRLDQARNRLRAALKATCPEQIAIQRRGHEERRGRPKKVVLDSCPKRDDKFQVGSMTKCTFASENGGE